MKLNSFKDLIVWQKSIVIVCEIYRITNDYPPVEKYSLATQMRRAAVSIPSNIAEGYKRKGLGDYIRFLSIAEASAAELETQVIISKQLYKDVDFIKIDSLLSEVQKMLYAMIKNLSK